MGWTDIIVLIFLIGGLIYILTSRELFSMSLPQSLGGRELIGLDLHHLSLGGKEIGSLTPFTCPEDKPDLDGALCYQKCREGYRGSGPVCWAETESIGVGTPVGLEPCPDGWNNDGLTCREPIGCHSINDCVWRGRCGCWGGGIKGRLDHGGVCPGPGGGNDHTDKVDGLCYKKCPAKKPHHLPGMPYLCYIGGALSYPRGVGKVPALFRALGKYPFMYIL